MKERQNHTAISTQTLYPVILPVPVEVGDYTPRERVVFLSRHARKALKQSADKSGIELDKLEKNEDGVPLPSGGNYWSISHKNRYVCGVVAPHPVGIDIERVREFSEGLFKKTATAEEWALADMETESVMSFFRFWTAKEAVLKATGIGIKDLLRCRVNEIIDETHLQIQYSGKNWLIEHFFHDDHMSSIVKGTFHIYWSINS